MAKNKKKLIKPKKQLTPEQQQAADIQGLLGPGAAGSTALANQVYSPNSLGRVEESMSPEVNNYLAQQRAMAAFYGPGGQQRSAEMQDYMARQKAGLEGYTGQEMTGMREQMGRQNDAAYANQRAQMATQQARSGVRGANAGAQMMALARAKAGQDAQLNQDLMVKNADEKQRRLSAYGQDLSNLEGSEFSRSREAMDAYGRDLSNARSDVLARQQFNIGQTEKEKALYLGTLLGGVGVAQQNEAARDNRRYLQGMLGVARRNARSSGTQPNPQGYANELVSLYGG